ncbi:AAA family ATPase [uncultured Bacteroides sp.]|uniref:AAA family ATPase n=1 Tax=uncultured Bacteroides sp. TaxID=162156 RepID=UPI0026242A88|nr:AAA family ATPase [uncultured Bacteroides sp.]
MDKNLRIRIGSLLEQLNEQVFGKEHIIALALLSAVAGESIFLLGPPGVAKSMVARRLKLAFRRREAFEYLMSRFSTPDEIFGPVSITKLKSEDTFERMVDGYLPTATVAFLDEIWKAGPAIQNALLTIVNEKIYRNGTFTIKVPLKGLIAASNELPAVGQGLDALWDRFLLRVLVAGVEDMSDFDRMIIASEEMEPEVAPELSISDEEYVEWQRNIATVKIPYAILDVIHLLKEKIEDYNRQLQNDEGLLQPLYVSDRRWKKLVKILRASAYLNGEEEVHLSDCFLLTYGLWNEVSQRKLVEEMVQEAISQSTQGYMLNLKQVDREIKALKNDLASEVTLRESQDPGLQLVDSYYYQIEKVRLSGKLLMFASDYQALDDTGKLFYLHKDKYKSQCYILKKYDLSMRNKVPQNKIYSIKKGRRSVFINNYEYPLLCTPDCMPLPAIEVRPEEDINTRFSGIGNLIGRVEEDCKKLLDNESRYCDRHLFLTEQEKRYLSAMLKHHQNDILTYRNELNELNHAYRKENKEYPDERAEGDLFG